MPIMLPRIISSIQSISCPTIGHIYNKTMKPWKIAESVTNENEM